MARTPEPAVLREDALAELRGLMAGDRTIIPMAFGPGERIIREGDRSRLVYVVLEGGYRVEQQAGLAEEGPVVLAAVRCDPGSFTVIGEMACLGDVTRTASVLATELTRVLCLTPDHIDLVIERCPRLTRVLLGQFAARLQEANGRIRELEGLLARQVRRRR